jgi:nucleotide-binding universal stress UspA family protein
MNYNMLTEDEDAQLPINQDELKDLTQKSQDYLGKVAEGLRIKGIHVNTVVATGRAAEEIVKTARAMNANLIAMSTHGRSGIIRWAIGSVTGKVMRLEGKIPVLAVKASPEKAGAPVLPMESLQSLMKHT